MQHFLYYHPSFSSLKSKLQLLADEKMGIAISSSSVITHYAKQFPFLKWIEVPDGEPGKRMGIAELCWRKLAQSKMDRTCQILSIGGGAVSDLAGFVASCYMRGVDVVHVPTTLVGMVDASIGGKTALNIREGKNLVGSFYLPESVEIYSGFLKTLPEREFRCGLAEVIKYALLGDLNFFFWLEEHIEEVLQMVPSKIDHVILTCSQMKLKVIKKDFLDQLGIRSGLNLGHTFAHAIEQVMGFSVLHGEAVAMGLSCIALLSYQLKKIPFLAVERIDALLKRCQLPCSLPNSSTEKLIEQMKKDKKNKNGEIRCILLEDIGKVSKPTSLRREILVNILNQKKIKSDGRTRSICHS